MAGLGRVVDLLSFLQGCIPRSDAMGVNGDEWPAYVRQGRTNSGILSEETRGVDTISVQQVANFSFITILVNGAWHEVYSILENSHRPFGELCRLWYDMLFLIQYRPHQRLLCTPEYSYRILTKSQSVLPISRNLA